MSDRLYSLVAQIKGLVDEANALANGDTTPVGTYPRIVTIDGASMEVAAPLAADWVPSMTDRELTRYGSFGSEPSNGAQYGQPIRSPAGYPLRYTPNGMGGFVGTPTVVYDGQTFPDDAAVIAYKAAVAERDRNVSVYRWPSGPR